jgi:hypothetical protein
MTIFSAVKSASLVCAALLASQTGQVQEKAAPAPAQVHVVVTDSAFRLDQELPPLTAKDVKLKLSKNPVEVSQLVPAQGQNATMQLLILLDEVTNTSIGNDLNDLKDFIKSEPPTTLIAIGYMSNANVNIVQNFTQDHELAANAVRLPRGSMSTMDSPYLSLMSVIKGWPQHAVRREVLMITDGIDRARGERPQMQMETMGMGPRGRRGNVYASPNLGYQSLPTISQDAQQASRTSQRYNVIVFTLFAPGVGRAGRSQWDLEIGLSNMTMLSEESGGECFALSTTALVSFKPYLDRLDKELGNQYYMVFPGTQGKNPGLQGIDVKTLIPNSELLAPDNVWVGPQTK